MWWLDCIGLANYLPTRGFTLKAGQIAHCGTHSPIWYHDEIGAIVLEMPVGLYAR